ncbi:MAG: 30S ribosomal protein S6 [Patescibacteria group bacterium]|nr:30S ribosomal protein S6 [Patescibacteria group bacterium]
MDKKEVLENIYEFTFVSLIEMSPKIRQIIEKNTGVVILEKELQKIRLAYPVKKQQYGFLGMIEFKVKPNSIETITKDIKLENNIIRNLICSLKFKKPSEHKRKNQYSRDNKDRIGAISRVAKKTADTGLTNEALEKKIEEILK